MGLEITGERFQTGLDACPNFRAIFLGRRALDLFYLGRTVSHPHLLLGCVVLCLRVGLADLASGDLLPKIRAHRFQARFDGFLELVEITASTRGLILLHSLEPLLHLFTRDLAGLDHLGHLLDRLVVVGLRVPATHGLLLGGAVSHPHLLLACFEPGLGVGFADLTGRDLSPKFFADGLGQSFDLVLEFVEVDRLRVDAAAILRHRGRIDGGGGEGEPRSREQRACRERAPPSVQGLGLIGSEEA